MANKIWVPRKSSFTRRANRTALAQGRQLFHVVLTGSAESGQGVCVCMNMNNLRPTLIPVDVIGIFENIRAVEQIGEEDALCAIGITCSHAKTAGTKSQCPTDEKIEYLLIDQMQE
jgi:hypothetical protein